MPDPGRLSVEVTIQPVGTAKRTCCRFTPGRPATAFADTGRLPKLPDFIIYSSGKKYKDQSAQMFLDQTGPLAQNFGGNSHKILYSSHNYNRLKIMYTRL